MNSKFEPMPIDAAYVNALVELVTACREYGIEINEVKHFQGGWHVTFKGYEDADAVCHDGSYGSPCYGGIYRNFWEVEDDYSWETIGFPWDGDDVSVHTSRELVFYLYCLRLGIAPWDEDEDEE